MPTTITIQSIIARQSPFWIELDGDKRNLFSVNFDAKANVATAKWEEVIAKLLHDADLALVTENAAPNTLFIGGGGDLPEGNGADGPYITLINTGGTTPLETHDGQQTDRLSFQILVTARDYRAGRDRIVAIWELLHGLRNTDVTIT